MADAVALACTSYVATSNLSHSQAQFVDSGDMQPYDEPTKPLSQIQRLETPIRIRVGDDRVILTKKIVTDYYGLRSPTEGIM